MVYNTLLRVQRLSDFLYWQLGSRTDRFKLSYLRNKAVYFAETCTVEVK